METKHDKYLHSTVPYGKLENDQEMEKLSSNTTSKTSNKKDPGTSSFVKGGIGLMVPSTIDMLVGFSTTYWATWTNEMTGENGGYGLWQIWHCRPSDEEAEMGGDEAIGGTVPERWGDAGKVCQARYADFSFPGWYVVTQVMSTLSLAGMLCAIIMLLLYIFWSPWKRKKSVITAIISISYISGLFLLVALFVFGFKVAEEIEQILRTKNWILSWSYSLLCTAFVMNQIAASILVTENKRLPWGSECGDLYPLKDHEGSPGLPTEIPLHQQQPLWIPEGSVPLKDFRIGPPSSRFPASPAPQIRS